MNGVPSTVEATFVPAPAGRVPGAGALALWPVDEHGGGGEPLTLVLARGRTVRRTTVPSRRVALGEALPALVELPADADTTPSLAGWAVAAQLAVDLVARGRLLPGLSPHGTPSWRVGPLDPDDHRRLDALAVALAPEAHALPVEGTRPLRIRDQRSLVSEFVDAVADRLVRSAAAAAAGGGPLAAGVDDAATAPGDVLGGWLATAGAIPGDGAVPGLRLQLPDGPGGFRAVVQLRSRSDASLVVDAADLWTSPAAVLARLGEHVDTDLLLALRRAARAWPPAGRLLDDARPDAIDLDDDEAADLLAGGTDALGGAGIEVLWPSELLAGRVTLRAVVGTPAPAGATEPTLTLDQLLDFRWEATVGDLVLDVDEIAALAEAKRPVVRLRGRWVLADPELAERLRRRDRRLTAVEGLTAALAGQLEIAAGDVVDVRAEGALAAVVDRLAAGGARELAEPPGLAAALRPYQRRGLAWLAEMTTLGLGGCLADDMGLGKTIQVIALHLHGLAGGRTAPMLVVCPASLLGNWERELGRFAPTVPVRRFYGAERHLDDLGAGEVVLATYGIVRRDHDVLAEVGWGLVVADEAQHAKNPLARTARALRAIPASARVALTGTPVENRLAELWSILDWTTPGLLGPLETFRRRVAVPVERHRDPDAAAAFARLVRPFLLRRRKIDPGIAPELPPKTETDVVVPLTPEQVTLYEAVVRETMASIAAAEGIQRRGLVLKLLTELKQVCNHPAQYLGQRGPLAGRSGKLDALDELLGVVLDAGDAVLVFTQYVAMARLLERHLSDAGVGCQLLHGGVPPAARDRMVARFQGGEVPVFLLSLKAGGTGLNLTTATHVVHYDRWWNPAVEDQASDRAWRIGQDRPVQVHRLVTEGTVEDRVGAMLATKRALADAVVSSGEAWLSELDDEALAELVTLGGQR